MKNTPKMRKQPACEKLPAVFRPVADEINNLLEMFEFYLMERRLAKPIEILADSVRDLRIIIQQILLEHFLFLSAPKTERFMKSLAVLLAKRSKKIPAEGADDKKYVKYLIGEMLVCFEWAAQIKRELKNDEVAQRILALDIPVLRPFDYGLRAKIRLVSPPRRR